MANPTSDTLNGRAASRQQAASRNFRKGTEVEDEVDDSNWKRSMQDLPQAGRRLLGLTDLQQRLVKAVRKCPGSNSKTISEIVHATRGHTHEQLLKLANHHRVLKYKKGNTPNPGKTAIISFYLANDISAELVDAILENPDFNQDEENTSQAEVANDSDSNGSFASPLSELPQQELELGIILTRAGESGITLNEITNITGKRLNTVYRQALHLIELGLASRELLPGCKNKHSYFPTQSLIEAVEWLPQKEEKSQPNTNPDVDTSETMTSKSPQPKTSQSTEDVVSQLAKELEDVWQVMFELAEKHKDLESRFTRIEGAVQGKRTVKADDIRAILYSKEQ